MFCIAVTWCCTNHHWDLLRRWYLYDNKGRQFVFMKGFIYQFKCQSNLKQLSWLVFFFFFLSSTNQLFLSCNHRHDWSMLKKVRWRSSLKIFSISQNLRENYFRYIIGLLICTCCIKFGNVCQPFVILG